MTENSSGKQVCCLLERVVKERDHLGYTSPFLMHDMKSEEVSESELSSSPLADGGKGH